MRQLFSELQDVDTSEFLTEEATKARKNARVDESIARAKIAAEAAQIFNR